MGPRDLRPACQRMGYLTGTIDSSGDDEFPWILVMIVLAMRRRELEGCNAAKDLQLALQRLRDSFDTHAARA